MKKLLRVVVPSFVGACLWSAPAAAQKVEHEWTAKAVAATFQQRCAGCHVVPDVSLRMDRAWLDQINRTT